MLPLRPRAPWGRIESTLYTALVARGQEALYGRLLALLPGVTPPFRALDVGCGPGHAAVMLAKAHPEATIVGVDTSPKMVAHAQSLAQKAAASNVSFALGDALRLPFEPQRFDIVYSFASIKHWPHPEQGLREIFRVLEPNGSAVVLEADPGAPDHAIRAHGRSWPWLPEVVFALAFRRVVAPAGLRLEDALKLARSSPFASASAERLADLPFVAMRFAKTPGIYTLTASKDLHDIRRP